MSITPETVAHVAKLARLALSPDEIARYTQDLGNIMTLIEQLDTLDLDGVEESLADASAPVVLRADLGVRDFERDALLANAPDAENGFFRVPKILSAD